MGELVWSSLPVKGASSRTYAELAESFLPNNLDFEPHTVRYSLSGDIDRGKHEEAREQLQYAIKDAFPSLTKGPIITFPNATRGIAKCLDIFPMSCGLGSRQFVEKAHHFNILGETLGAPVAIGPSLAMHETVLLISNVSANAKAVILKDPDDVLKSHVNRRSVTYGLTCQAVFEVFKTLPGGSERRVPTAQLLLLIDVHTFKTDSGGEVLAIPAHAAAATKAWPGWLWIQNIDAKMMMSYPYRFPFCSNCRWTMQGDSRHRSHTCQYEDPEYYDDEEESTDEEDE